MSEIDKYLEELEKNPDQAKSAANTNSRNTDYDVDAYLASLPAPDKGIGGHLKDTGISLAQGIIAAPEALVGLADIPTGGRVGKFLENEDGMLGFRPKQAREFLGEFKTDKSKEQQQEFQEADGILAKTGVALRNPSMIANTVVESAPSIGMGGVFGRGLVAGAGAVNAARAGTALSAAEKAEKARKLAPIAGAVGEGLTMAGAQASEIRSETEDGLLTGTQSVYSGVTGVLGTLFGWGGSRLAQRLGIGDIDTLVTQGAKRADIDRAIAQEIASAPAKSLPRSVIEGAITEGFLEELPQSVSEQILQNLALDRDWSEGIEDAAVMGTLAGMAMGAGASGYSNLTRPQGEQGGPQGGQGDQQGAPGVDTPPPAASATNPFDQDVPETSINVGQLEQQGVTPPPVFNPEHIERNLGPTPSQQMGLDPNVGPNSAAAALAVDSGLSQQVVAQQAQQDQVAQTPPDAVRGVDPETGEVLQQGSLLDGDPVVQMQSRLDYLQQQARRTGWNKQLLRERDQIQARLQELGVQPEPREQVQSRAEEVAAQTLASGGTEDDAMRAATDTLIDGMDAAPDIEIANDAPAAVSVAKARTQESQAAAEQPATDIKAITSKQIPQMTDAEITQAIEHYGPDHKRTKKLQKELQKRGQGAQTTAAIAPGDSVQIADGLGSDVDGQTGRVISVRGDTASVEVAGERYDGVPVSELKKRDEAPSAEVAQQALEKRRAAQQQADVAGAAPAETSPAVDPSARWDGMSEAERTAALLQTGRWTTKGGALNVIGKKRAKADLDKMPADERAAVEQVLLATVGDKPKPAKAKSKPAPSAATEELTTVTKQDGTPFASKITAPENADNERDLSKGEGKKPEAATDPRVSQLNRLKEEMNALADRADKAGDLELATRLRALYGTVKPVETDVVFRDLTKHQVDTILRTHLPSVTTAERNAEARRTKARTDAEAAAVPVAKTLEEAVISQLKKAVKEIRDKSTNDGRREPDARWERGAIARIIREGLAKTYLSGKQTGPLATAKIGISKAESLDDIQKVIDKLEAAATPAPSASEAQQSAPDADSGRKYHVVRINEKTGKKVTLSATPMTHQEAVTFKSKQTKHEWARDQLEEVTEQASSAEAQADVDSLLNPEQDSMADTKEVARADAAPTVAAAPEAETKAKDADRFAGNKLFTADKVAAARARMKSKFGQLNSGIDPEMLVDGMTIAGAYIESGVRNFTQYAKAMVEDFGDGVKPYLLSFWEGARNYPGLDTKDMTSVDDSRSEYEALITPAQAAEIAPDAVGQTDKAPKKRARKTGAKGDMVLTQDWGVEHIDGYGDSTREEGNETKDAFLKETRNYLNAVADALRSHGYEPHPNRKGKPGKPVSVNQSGVAGSGDVTLTMRDPDTGFNVYIHIGDTALRGVVPTTDSGIAIMYRVGQGDDQYATRAGNTWAPVTLSANELAGLIASKAQPRGVATNEQSTDGDADQGGAPEVRTAGSPAQQTDTPADSGGVAQGQPENVQAAGEAEGAGRSGVRVPRTDVADSGAVPRGRDATDGRAGAGGAGAPNAGAGAGSRGASGAGNTAPVVSPAATAAQAQDLHIENPLEVVGGTPVQRFNKNREALELLQELEVEGRKATPEEQKVLAGYTGWGSFGQELFQGSWDHPKYRDEGVWKERGQWLRDMLGEEAWKSAQRSITNAHYTDPPTVMAMWDMVRRMGFEGGRVLEPSMGTGNFFSMMPADIKARSQLTGIELDETTGAIAKQLFPQSNIRVMGYQESKTPDNFYDVIIGNWPFENTPVADRRYNRLNPMLHDYFFLKTMDQVRPGGIVIGITSAGSMDKQNAGIRRELAKQAELVTSIRLPSGAFENYAGTKVVTDIIVLRKRPEKLAMVPEDATWVDTGSYKTPSGENIRVNQYYIDNPGNVIGTLDYGHGTTMFGAGMIVHRPDNMEQRLREAIELVPEGAMQPDTATDHLSYYANETGERHGSLSVQNGELMLTVGDQLIKAEDRLAYAVASAKTTEARKQQIAELIELRKLHTALTDAERAGDDADTQRAALKKAYQAFVKEHGSLRKSFALRYMERIKDPFYYSMAAIENDDGTPTSILERSTVRGRRTIDQPTIREAYVLARNQSITPSLAEVAELSGKTEAEVKAELVDSGAVFEAPNGGVVPSDIYLSGNVRQKMREARAALEDGNEAMTKNVEALEAVIPPDVPYFNIETKLGATWVPAEKYRDYIASMLGRSNPEGVDVAFRSGRWSVRLDKSLNRVPEASTNYGTSHYAFSRLVQAAMSNQVVTIKKKDTDGSEYVDREATTEVNSKIGKIREDFATWLWSDPERRVSLELEYNESRNAWATPKYDGSFLTFEGMALSLGEGEFNLRKHQANAIWRAIVNRRSLNAHEVGTGKTFTMGGIAIESRRYGIAKKPVLLAHNANSASVAAEIQMMYPSARILYISSLNPAQREIRLRQIANEDWDLIVMPHSLIDRMALTEETLMRMAQDDIANLEAEMREAAAEDGVSVEDVDLDDDKSISKIRSVTAKELAKARKRIIETIKKQAQQASKESAVIFEDLGIDMILVDEVHEFKKPPIVTRMKMKGLNTDTSQRSIALQFLTRYVRQMNNGGNVHTFTGTPITNTITEIYHQMRYVMESEMEQANVADWDGWFGSFATEVQDVELTGAGDYEMVTRLAGFVNVPELRQMVGQYMDTVFAEDMPEMKPRKTKSGKVLGDEMSEAERAELLNGRTEDAKDRPYKKVINDTADMLDEQVRVFQEVQDLAREWRDAGGKQRKDWMNQGAKQSPIVYENIANTASMDVRLLDDRYVGMEGKTDDPPNSKASRAIKNVVEIYKSHPLANQVIFTDTGYYKTTERSAGRDSDGNKVKVKVKVFSPVHDMVLRLIDAGIPKNQIAVVNGQTSKERRRAIAEAMNEGTIRVVIGSTDTLGVGVNMQRNLRAMHHLDAPYMPGELEQRNGRGQRQGNQWNTVLEYRYMTDRLDGKRWQILAVKQRFINAFMKANSDARVIEGEAAAEEQSDILESFSEAAGDPRILQREKLQKKLDSLKQKERMYTRGIADIRSQIRSSQRNLERAEKQLSERDADAVLSILKAQRESYDFKLDGKQYSKRADAVKALDEYLAKKLRVGGPGVDAGEYAGMALRGRWPSLSDHPEVTLSVAGFDFQGKGINGLEAVMRNAPDQVARLEREAASARETIANMERALEQPFGQAEELKRAEKQLDDLEKDLAANPVPPPAWLRQGAPMDSEVFRNKQPFVVTGHRYTDQGWFVVAEDAKGTVVIPYLEATDAAGMALYDEREFTAPEVVEAAAPEQKQDDPKFSFAGQRSGTAMHGMLADAKRRVAQGADAEQVRQLTGWHRGVDGKWRYEISDADANLKVSGKNAGDLLDMAALDAFADNRKHATVADLLDHSKLFEAYPQLASIPVRKMKNPRPTAVASVQVMGNEFVISLNPSVRSGYVASALIHELQHAIQTIEGFARGGNSRMAARLANLSVGDKAAANVYMRLAGEVEARNTQARMNMDDEFRKLLPPAETQDVTDAEAIVTFDGVESLDFTQRDPITREELRLAFARDYPKLSTALGRMLERGDRKESGGLVILESSDPLKIARKFSQITGKNLSKAIRMFDGANDAQGFYDPRTGLTFLVGPSVTEANAAAVVLHEAVHGQQNKRLDQAAVQMLVNRKQEGDKNTRDFLDRVVRRMARAEGGVVEQEAAAYIVEQAILEGRDTGGHSAIDGKLMTWIENNLGKTIADLVRDFVKAYRQFALRHGLPLKVTIDDMIDYAQASMKQSAKEGASSTQGAAAFSRDAIPQTETEAFKRWFGDSKVVDADGKPLVVYHGTTDEINIFDRSKLGSNTGARTSRLGFFFSDDVDTARGFSEFGSKAGSSVVSAYVSIKKPITIRSHLKERETQFGNRVPVKDNLGDVIVTKDAYTVFWEMMESATGKSKSEITPEDISTWVDGRLKAGFDGIIFKDTNMDKQSKPADHYVAFRPEQIKSATGNVGAYGQRPVTADEAAALGMTQDEANNAQSRGDIRFSRGTHSDFRRMTSMATSELNKTFNAPGKLHWWHKTVGTMYNLAERSPAFKPVFEAAQGFIDDVAYFAADAAELAPRLLPKMETWRDIAKRPISAEDNKAISAPIFEGTLLWTRDDKGKPVRLEEDSDAMDGGIVWTPAELKSYFNLTGEDMGNGQWSGQIGLYQEFREATDRSLDTMGRADMMRFVGKESLAVRDAVMDADNIQSAAFALIDHLKQLADERPDHKARLMELAHGVAGRAERVVELQESGYAPLSRFGKYTVDVVVDGQRQYFSLFESMREANKMAEAMRAEFGDGAVSQGTLSDESFKLFAGVTPETLELFGNMLGLDSEGNDAQDAAFQEYLRLTKTNRSAMRRLIHRKGIAGYSEDAGRVLASFVYSNARQTAAGLNIGQLGEAIQEIPKEQGQLKDAAVRLSEYIKNPQEEAQAARGLLFAQYLGGSVASAFVNLTQPVQVTFPWLSQYGGARRSAAELTKAVKQMSTRGFKYEADLAAALAAAEDDGTVSPQEVHQLMAQARGSGSLRSGDGTKAGETRAFVANQMTRLSLAWGKMFGAAEQANRRITFIAAYRIARDQGMADPAAFARRAVRETQFVYSKASKMQWGRGAVGGTLMTFKTYSVSYIELMHRLWNQGEPGSEERAQGRKAAMIMVATLALVGGAGGLPFAEDIEDLLDGMAQLMGYNISVKKKREEATADFLSMLFGEAFGEAMAEFVDKGVSGLPGVPLDVSGRLGMGNLIPGTGLFTERRSHTRDVLEILGPGGDFANRMLSGGKQILGGNVGAGLLEMSPVAVRNLAKGTDMAVHGMYRDTKGYKVLDTNILEAALKAGGFQPAAVAKIQEANWIAQRSKNFYSMKAQEIRALWAAGIFEKDPAKVERARGMVQAWNTKNPDQRMVIRIPDVMRRVREMSKTKDERIAATAPKAMRAQIRQDLEQARGSL